MRTRSLERAALLTTTMLGIVLAVSAGAAPCTLDRARATSIDARPFIGNGYGARWNAPSDRVAYMQPGADGYYRIYTMSATGGDPSDPTAHQPNIPRKHLGSPYWHPSGRYLVFTAQKEQWHGARLFGSRDYEALPGFGRHDDLWLIEADGSHAWQLTHDPNTKDEGILIPVFSPDGTRLAWSARQPGGTYALTLADLVLAPEPHLENLRIFRPGGAGYYETGSFTSDGASLTYSSDQDTRSFWRSQIYRLDLASGQAIRLTQGSDYNEHPTVIGTPVGDWIVYMSTRGVQRYPWSLFLGTDWYAMRIDGTGIKRLTSMNLNRKDNPQNRGALQVAGTVAVAPSGDFMLGDVQDNLLRQTGMVKIIRFACD